MCYHIRMTTTKRAWDILTDEERTQSIKELTAYYLDERGEDLDIIGANELLDTFLQYIAPHVYNKAIEDVRVTLKQQAEHIDIELGVLKK